MLRIIRGVWHRLPKSCDGILPFQKRCEKASDCMKTNLSTLLSTARLAAGRWFVAAVLLCGVGVRAAVPAFTNVTATVTPDLPQVGFSAAGWTDYDTDGRLDFLLTGIYFTNIPPSTYPVYISQVWRNTGSGFTNVPDVAATDVPGVNDGSKSWGDFDNDGRLDFLTSGGAIWRNTENGFTNVTASVAPGLPGVWEGAAGWGDYDNDGRLDFLITGGIPRRTDLDDDIPFTPISQLWRNTGSGFANVTATVAPGLPGSFYGSVAWADYDNDGRLDFLLSGQLFRNTGSGFLNVTATVAPGMPGNAYGSASWGDYDNDGRLDLLLSGQIWRNTVNGFTNVTATVAPGLQRVWHDSVAWGDYDDDGRLDFLLTGATHFNCDGCDLPGTVSQLWRNTTPATNPPPAIITGLPESATPTSVVLNASIHPHRQATTGWFIWGDSTNHGQVTAAQPRGSGNAFTNFFQAITGLSTGVTYYYRAVGSNDQGKVVLGVQQHFTLAPPLVTTSPADRLSPTSVTINGHLNPNNLPTYGWLEWGPTPALGVVTPVQFLANGFDATVSQNLPDLGAGATCYFRAVASNSFGVVYGAIQTLVTPTFANVTATVAPGLPQLGNGSVAWADYDNDGRLDFLLTGYFDDREAEEDLFYSQLWRNTGSGFAGAGAAPGLEGVWFDSVAWGDYDNDGRLDFLITGARDIDGRYEMSQVWRNTGNGFTNATATVAPGLPQVAHSSVAWGDYDNDGRLDFLLTGLFYYEGDEPWGDVFVSQLWRNTGNGFTNVTATVAPGLPGVGHSSVAWGDYDNDGRLDFLLTGYLHNGTNNFISQVWRNTGSGFTNVTDMIAPGLQGVYRSSVAWGDYDNDGRLDFLLTGTTNGGVGSEGTISQLWRNTGSGFTNVTDTVALNLPGVSRGTVAWGDYDNDGRLDFLLSGLAFNSDDENFISQLWRNTGSGFTNVTAMAAPGLPGIIAGSVAWGDYDNDGRLDFLLTGYDYNNFFSQVWRNYTPLTNTPPSAPTGLAMTATTNAVMLSWNSTTDGQTPASGLTYNVRAGATPGGNDLLSAHVNATNGFRRVPAMGNAMLRHSLPLTGLTNGQTVYWSVQAVDTAFAGGPFAIETSVVSLPALSISLNFPPSTLNVSWSPPTFGWVLQQGTNLGASDWTATTSGSANPATLAVTNGPQFYRLQRH